EKKSPTEGDRVFLLTGKDATYLGILRAIREHLVNKARRPEDTAILYFAGHGFADAQETYLAGSDTQLDMLADTSISGATLQRYWSQIPAGRKVLIADACHSGGLSGLRGVAGVKIAAEAQPAEGSSSLTITASGPNELSAEDEKLGHGV